MPAMLMAIRRMEGKDCKLVMKGRRNLFIPIATWLYFSIGFGIGFREEYLKISKTSFKRTSECNAV